MSKPGGYAVLDTGNPLSAGLRHFWACNKGSGTILADLGFDPSPGTLTAESMWETDPDVGGTVLAFNTNYRVNLGTPNLQTVGSYFLRFRTTSTYVAALLANEITDNSEGFALNLYNGQAYWTEREDAVDNAGPVGSSLADGNWHSVCYVAHGDGCKLYIDGSLIVSAPGETQIHVGRNLQAWLGFMHDAGTDYWMIGAIDIVADSDDIWDDATVASVHANPYQFLVVGPLTAGAAPTLSTKGPIWAKVNVSGATGGIADITDTVEWSQDGGTTWHPTTVNSPLMRLVGMAANTPTRVHTVSTDGTTTVTSGDLTFTTDPPIVPAKLFRTSERLTRWQRIWAGSSWIKSYLASKAAGEATGYSTDGSYNGLLYIITDDPAYAAASWNVLSTAAFFTSDPTTIPDGRNAVRGRYFDLLMLYSWLYDWMDSAKKAQFQSVILGYAEWAIGNTATYAGDFSTADSDQDAAQLIGLTLTDLYLGTDYLTLTTLQNHVPIGGLDETGVNTSTARNAIAWYCKLAAGGFGAVGSQYNTEDPYMMTIYAAAVKDATGIDHWDEVLKLVDDFCLHLLHELTPDFVDIPHWGDDEDGRSTIPGSRSVDYQVFPGLASEMGLGIAPIIQGMANELLASDVSWRTPFQGAWPFLFFDPDAPADTNWRQNMPRYCAGTGMGITLIREGDDINAVQVNLHGGSPTDIQHEALIHGRFDIYRKGLWAHTQPVAYNSGFAIGLQSNAFVHAGLPVMKENWGKLHQEQMPGSHYYMRSGTHGRFFYPTRVEDPITGFYDPPDPFVTEHIRTQFYLPSATLGSATLLIFDRVNSVSPTTVYGYAEGRYNTGGANSVQYLIDGAEALKMAVFHMPVSPTLTAGKIAWDLTNQHCQINTLLPTAHSRSVIDESLQGWSLAPGEYKYSVRVYPDADTLFATFLNIAQAYDTGVTLANTLVQSDGGEAQGAHVQRTGENDALVMFSAVEAARELTSGYSVSFTPATGNSLVYFLDLNPLQGWTCTINGGAPQNVPVSPAGIGVLPITGAGAKALVLTTSGAPAPLVAGVLTAVSHSSAGVLLSWTPGYGGSGTIQTLLEHSTDGGTTWLSTGETLDPGSDSGLTPASTIKYRVKYYDGTDTEYSNIQTVTLDSVYVPPPVAGLNVDTMTGVAPLSVVFSDASGGSIDTYSIDYGDGTTDTVAGAHTYMTAGTYTVTYTVTGAGGSDIVTKTITVSAAGVQVVTHRHTWTRVAGRILGI